MAAEGKLDALNRGIVEILQADPSTTNKKIGDELGVSEVTVASRIRAMENARILRVMLQRDTGSLGYHLMALIDIRVEGRRLEEVAAELAEVDELISVSIALSSPDILLHAMARDNRHLQTMIEDAIAPIRGIVSYEITTVLEILKMINGFGALEVG